MAWEISHSPEIWDDLRETIRDMYAANYDTAHEWFCEALAYARTVQEEHDGPENHAAKVGQRYDSLLRLRGDTIEDLVIEQIRETNTTDNGGFAFYIDRHADYTLTPKGQT